MPSDQSASGLSIILAATGALAVAAVVIKQVYEGGKLPVGAGGVSDAGFLLVTGAVLTVWSVAVVAGLSEFVEVAE